MGHINPDAPWDHIGALDKRRIERFGKGWMLPSSHLMLHESPYDAGKRILREQLGIEGFNLQGPRVFSDLDSGPGRRAPHWDIGFIFTGELGEDDVPRPKAWSELNFVDLAHIKKEEITRRHEDVLAHAGLTPGSSG